MRGGSIGTRRDVKPSMVEFVGLLRALGKAVAVYGVSHAQLERRLCSWILDGNRAQKMLDGSSGEGREDLYGQVSRMREVQESKLARADGDQAKAGGQRIGELLGGKAALHRKRVKVYVAVLLSFLEEEDPPGYADGEYGTPQLWHELWQDAIQGRMPQARLGTQAATVQGFVPDALDELHATGYGVPAPSQAEPPARPAPPEPVRTPAAGTVPRPAPEPEPAPGTDPGIRSGAETGGPMVTAAALDRPAATLPAPAGARYGPRTPPPISTGNLPAAPAAPPATVVIEPPEPGHRAGRAGNQAKVAEFPTGHQVRGWQQAQDLLPRLLGRTGTGIALVVVPILLLVVTAVALTLGVISGMVTFNATTSTELQFPVAYPLSPIPPGTTVPLLLAPATVDLAQTHPLTLVLHVTLASASETGDSCVHDSQLSYTVHDHGGIVGTGTLPPGTASAQSAPLRLRAGTHDLQVTFTLAAPATDTGCQLTLNPSGTTLTKTR